jgi:hypothetical protein
MGEGNDIYGAHTEACEFSGTAEAVRRARRFASCARKGASREQALNERRPPEEGLDKHRMPPMNCGGYRQERVDGILI